MRRVERHPILDTMGCGKRITLMLDGAPIEAVDGEPIAIAIMASGRRVLRYTENRHEPRGIFCALGRCTDCMMTVDGQPNVRTCITAARDGMVIETQKGIGHGMDPQAVVKDK
jgi:predicted molibdopterin-dependent oxidoreductase YjgC